MTDNPTAAEKKYGTAWLSMDGNCGCALVGENLQEGEAEFVCIDDAPAIHTHKQDKERWAMTQAHKRLCARLGVQLGYYWNYPDTQSATPPQDAEREKALDYDEIMEEAEKLFRKHRYSGGARGQMIRPADSLDYWVMRATESKLRALTTPPDLKAVREAQRRLDQIQSSYLIAKSTLERKSLAETESCDELFAPIRNILNRMDGGENGL